MNANKTTSTPDFFSFNPKLIPYQYNVIYDIKCRYDYSVGPQYVLLSGSVGSAKSTLMAWIIIDHCTQYDGARAMIGRKAMPDLKDTIFLKILEMLTNAFTEGVDYVVNYTSTSIRFSNGSEIISRSWHDKKYTKFRSLELSLIAIEELTENNNKEMEFFIEAIARLGRLSHVPQNIFIACTNPSDPSHKAYEFFIKDSKRIDDIYSKKDLDKHIYYSRTESNPFLPKWYIESLKEKYDEKMIKRLLYGQWLYINTDVIYYNYDPEIHMIDEIKINKRLPITLSFDFNISKGKPMSSCAYQFNKRASNRVGDKRFTFFDEVAVEGARTEDALEEWAGKGLFDLPHNPHIIIHGDAAGKHGSSKSKNSDYELIEKFLANYCRKDGDILDYTIDVPNSNPSLRDSHNIVNGQLKNSEGVIAVAIAKKCENIDKGFRNTRLKENAGYLEDQSTEGKDMSSAFRYGIWYDVEYELESSDAVITFR
jgi:hypothetical protein